MQTTESLTSKFLEGDIQAYECIFKMHYSELCLFATKFVSCPDTAEEIVQDLFCKIWEKKKSLHIETSIKSYLYGAVRLNCLKLIRDKKIQSKHIKEIKLNSDTISFEDVMENIELQKKIYDTIQQLPSQRRKIFELSRFENLKYREIAEKLELSPKTIENQMGKALKFIRENLKDYLKILVLLFSLK
ncbi:RNA polymerase sigma-70 factor [Aureivirga marina]|uniref:RNA polymerase sigma-70 factor n=1 Tax=Aureivirga marina TaxID=1182451 RepID=UPI0018CB6599|nr:RNA polymerase sigma-70 factor [Aureivirga marina]